MDTNTQIIPLHNFKIIIDSLSRKTFETNLPPNSDVEGNVFESRFKNIHSYFSISNLTSNNIRLSEFDRAVLNAAIAEQLAGNSFTTPERIFRLLGGKRFWTEDLRIAILNSFEKLACIRVTVDMSQACDKLNYNPKDGKAKFRGYLMPTETVSAKINGQTVDAIHFLGRGPIFNIADLKNQIISCDTSNLDVPVRSTPRTIAIKHYLLRRTLEIKGSNDISKSNRRVKPLRKIINFADLCDKCDLTNANRFQKRNAREAIKKILDYFVSENILKNYHFEHSKTGEILSIIIDF